MKKICFDLDGTICNLYGVEGWLDMLINEDPTPYAIGKPLLRLSILAKMLNKLQREGYELVVISWLAKNGSEHYNELVTDTKRKWLKKHMPSVTWNEIHIVEYGTPKEQYATVGDILFDDEEHNRNNWIGTAYDVNDIIGVLKTL